MMMALGFACVGFGQTLAAGEGNDMESRLQELEREVQEWRTQAQAGEMDKDNSSTRYDGSFMSRLHKNNESFEFNLESLIQARFQIDDVNDSAGSYVKEEDSAGFRLARVYTSMSGHVYNPAFTYNLVASWNNENLSDMLKVATFGYRPSDSLGFYIGRDKMPFNMQESTDASQLQFMERSAANEAFNMDYGHGGWLAGSPTLGDSSMMLRYALGVFNGNYNNLSQSDTNANPNNEDFAWTYAGRVEFLPMGGSGSITESESDLRSEEDKTSLLVMVGLGVNYGKDRGSNRVLGQSGIASPFEADIFNLAYDLRVHAYGASLNAGVFGRWVRFDDASDETATHPGHLEDFGWYAQLGYNVNIDDAQLEGVVRISSIDYDEFQDGAAGTATGSDAMGDDLFEVTGGLNLRVAGDDLRFGLEATYRSAEEADNFNTIPSWTFRLGVQIRF